MKDAILDKIGRHLEAGVTEEKDIVYLFVEIRKFYNQSKGDIPNRKKRFPFFTLRLCCDWVAHVEMNWQDAKCLLDRVHRFLEDTRNSPDQRADHSYFQALIRFETLRLELTEFIQEHGLPTFDDLEWNVILSKSIRVIADCPLKIKDHNKRCIDEGSVLAKYHNERCVDEGLVLALDFPDRLDIEPPPVVFIFKKKGELVLRTSANARRRHQVEQYLEENGWGLSAAAQATRKGS